MSDELLARLSCVPVALRPPKTGDHVRATLTHQVGDRAPVGCRSGMALCGSCGAAYPNPNEYQGYLALSEHRAAQALAAVLPDLLEAERERASADLDRIARALAAAWDAGMEFVRSHPDMAAEYYRAANPYRKEPR